MGKIKTNIGIFCISQIFTNLRNKKYIILLSLFSISMTLIFKLFGVTTKYYNNATKSTCETKTYFAIKGTCIASL